MDIKCQTCQTVCKLTDKKIPLGRSYVVCPKCESRIDIFRGVARGATLQNLTGVRFMADGGDLMERYCEPGEQWRVMDVMQPCPERGKHRACELENKGRCPNQRLVLRLRRERTLYKSCLYRKGRKIFEKGGRIPVGVRGVSTGFWPPDSKVE